MDRKVAIVSGFIVVAVFFYLRTGFVTLDSQQNVIATPKPALIYKSPGSGEAKLNSSSAKPDQRTLKLIAEVSELAKLAPKLHRITDKDLAMAIERFGDKPEFYIAAYVSRRDLKYLRNCLEKHPDAIAARYVLLGEIVFKKKTDTAEFAQELAKLKTAKGFEAYGIIIEWLSAAQSGDTESLLRLSQNAFPSDIQLLSPDYDSSLMAMLTEVCGLDLAKAFQQSRHMELGPPGVGRMFAAISEQYNELITRNRGSEARNLLAAAANLASSFPGDDLEIHQGRLRMEYDMLNQITPGQEADSIFQPSLAEYRQQLEGELQQALTWHEKLLQAASNGDVALVSNFVHRAAEVGEISAAKELLGVLP